MEKNLLAKKQEWLDNFMSKDGNDAISYDMLSLALLGKDNNALKRAMEIEKTLPLRYDGLTGLPRIIDMYKNHIIERKVLETLNYINKEAHIDFYDYGSYYFHTGKGNATPDFIDQFGNTYELKRYVLKYDNYKWWNANVKLVYRDRVLYELNKDGTLDPLCNIDLFK